MTKSLTRLQRDVFYYLSAGEELMTNEKRAAKRMVLAGLLKTKGRGKKAVLVPTATGSKLYVAAEG